MTEPLSPMFHPNDFAPDNARKPVEPDPGIAPASETISIADLFLFNTAHRDFVLGKSRHLHTPLMLGMGGCGVLFIIPFVLAGLLIFSMTVNGWITSIRLKFNGATVQGQIVGLRIDTSSDSDTYYATYRFYAQNQSGPYTKEQSINSDLYNNLREGSRINVTYHRADPTLSRLTDNASYDLTQNILLSIFTAIWNLIIWGLVIGGVQTYRRAKRLEREGQLLKGTVVSCKGSTDSDGDYSIALTYAFHSPTGRNISRKESWIRNDLKTSSLPSPGTRVAILYADDACYQVM